MKYFDWDAEKNERLKAEREVSFEEVINAINEGNLLDTIEHPRKDKYSNQMVYIVNINEYVYLVPFVTEGEKIFLKTIFPSRKMTKRYLIERKVKK